MSCLMYARSVCNLLASKNAFQIPKASYKKFGPPPKLIVKGFPDQNKLKPVLKVPIVQSGQKVPKMMRQRRDMRGCEEIHTKFIHQQYGIVGLWGGELKFGHFEMMRNTINRKLDMNRVFAIWRVDPPWKSVSSKGVGAKMGKGKGAIDHWVTPVKAGRVIIECGGTLEFEEVRGVLEEVAHNLPFPARAMNQEMMEQVEKEAELVRKENINPYTWEWCLKNNIMNCHYYASPYDIEWSYQGPKFR